MFDHCDNCGRLLLVPYWMTLRRIVCPVKENHYCMIRRMNDRIICSVCKRSRV